MHQRAGGNEEVRSAAAHKSVSLQGDGNLLLPELKHAGGGESVFNEWVRHIVRVLECLHSILPALKPQTIPLFESYTVQKKHIMSLLLQLAGEEVKHLAFFPNNSSWWQSRRAATDEVFLRERQTTSIFWLEVVEYFTNSLQEKDSHTLSTSLWIKLNVNSFSVFLFTDKWQMMNW